MTILPIIGIAISILGFLGLLAAAFIVVRSGATKAAAEAWKGEAEAQKARADRLEAALSDLKVRVDRLEAEKATLTDIATQATAITTLSELVVRQHQETIYLIGSMTTAPTKRRDPDS